MCCQAVLAQWLPGGVLPGLLLCQLSGGSESSPTAEGLYNIKQRLTAVWHRCCADQPLFHASTWQCGAFPGSPVNAVQLADAPETQPVYWLSEALLSFFLLLRCSSPTLAVDAFVQALTLQHEAAAHSLIPGDTLRKVFGRAVNEHGVVQMDQE